MQTSENFAFLEATHPSLAEALRFAERHCFRDPASSLVKLRLFAELVCWDIAREAGVETPDRELAKLAHELWEAGLLPRTIDGALRRIRTAGNRAAHTGEGTSASAIAGLAAAHEVAVWFAEIRGTVGDPPPSQFRAPDPNADPEERLRLEAEALRHELQRLQSALLHQRDEFSRRASHETTTISEQTRQIATFEAEVAALRQELGNREATIEALSRASLESDTVSTQHSENLRQLHARIEELETGVASLSSGTLGEALATYAPQCPECGSATVQRRAVRGRNAGRLFWSCLRYPECRGAIEVEEGPEPIERVSTAPQTATPWPRRTWRETGHREGWSIEYTTAGGRLRCVDLTSDLDDRARALASQVAVFSSTAYGAVSPRARLVATALRRIVSRGAVPPVDPQMEDAILDHAGLTPFTRPARNPGDLSRKLMSAAPLPGRDAILATLAFRAPADVDESIRSPSGEALLEAQTEGRFLREVVPTLLGPDAANWFQPKVPLDLLLGPQDGLVGDWVTFFAAPRLARPLIVEMESRRHAFGSPGASRREKALRDAGYEVVRVRAEELQAGSGPSLSRLASLWPRYSEPSADARFMVWSPAVAQRILLAIAVAIDRGWLSGDLWHVEVEEPFGIGIDAVQSAVELADAVSGVFGLELTPRRFVVIGGDATASFEREEPGRFVLTEGVLRDGESGHTDVKITIDLEHGPVHRLPVDHGVPHVVVRSAAVPVDLVSDHVFAPSSYRVPDVSVPAAPALRRLLSGVFAKREFQPPGPEPRGQEVAIRRVLAGLDTTVLLPTGAGKSMIYQLAGLLLPGLTLVVDPIVSLIDDQIDGLAQHGIDRAFGITSADSRQGTAEDKLRLLRAGDAMFLFVAPERLQQQSFREAIRELATASPISIAVVDEAHCVSEWGHDFRTAYLDLGRVLRDVAADASGAAPPILALTGTASRAVLNDMLIELSMDRGDPTLIVSPETFDRTELRFGVIRAEDDHFKSRLIGTLRALPGRFADASVPRTATEFFRPRGDDSMCGIIFCQTVNGSKSISGIQAAVEPAIGMPVPIYSGSAPRSLGNVDFDQIKRSNAAAFKSNRATLLAATKAFGMGIDKPNVRFTIHAGIPGSIEAFYQEAGRAGRDRREAHCLIVSSDSDRKVHEFFHGKTFRGVEADVRDLERVLDLIGDVEERLTVEVPMPRDDEQYERAIHRLKLLGLVRDYVVDWRRRRYEVKVQPLTRRDVDEALLAFVRRSQPGRVPTFEKDVERDGAMSVREKLGRNGRRMIEFVYETIVAARVRAVDEMMLLVENCRDDAEIRDRIIRYISLTGVADELEKLLDTQRFRFKDWRELLAGIQTADEARDWRGATARLLESEPDHPGLLLGRGFAELVVSSGSERVFAENVERAVHSAKGKYDETAAGAEAMVSWLFRRCRTLRAAWVPGLYGVVARALGIDADPILETRERECLVPGGVDIPEELELVIARRLERHNAMLDSVVERHLGEFA